MSADKKARVEENDDLEIRSYYDSLPANVRRRVRALKKLQVEMMKIESKFHEEIHKIECKYAKMYEPLLEKREQITTGKYEPKDDECDFPEEEPMDEDSKKVDASMKGVPKFWLNVLESVELIRITIQEHDEPVLEHLIDIKVKLSEKPMGFKLEFHFSPNEYFSNTVLTKEYELKCAVDDEFPLAFEGPEIATCKGCEIKWKDGKNVTVQAPKKKGEKETPVESFFNFFSPPVISDKEDEDEKQDKEIILQEDYKIAELLRHTVVPCAVLHFTGEAGDDEYEDDDEDDEFDEDDEEIDNADYKKLKEMVKNKDHKKK